MAGLGKQLFRFGIVTDVHIAEAEHGTSSPFPVNRLTSWRYRHLVNRLNDQDLDFLINLGDMVHPLPSLPTYDEAASRFFALSQPLRHKQYFIPGNHDVGDKPSDWMPAQPTDVDALARFGTHFGPDYHSFEHKGIFFLMMNAELLNTCLPQREKQKTWVEQRLREMTGRRIFIMIHYPPFICDTDEVDHYDNITEPDRSWLLNLLEVHRVEAIFSGHVHNFWYNQLGDTDLYIVPSAAFPRQDYSEMYQSEPEPEGGRNDPAKLGFFTVDIHEHDHVWSFHRTFGEGLEPKESYISWSRPAMRHPLVSDGSTLGFDLRNSWITFHQIPPSGALDEFYRKEVRNDYPLLALCEMGARSLRLPVNDLLDVRVRARLAALKRFGFQYTFYIFGVPDRQSMQALVDFREMLSTLELVWPYTSRRELGQAVNDIRDQLAGVALFVSPLWGEHGRAEAGGRHYHVIRHGFQPQDRPMIEDFLSTSPPLEGLVFTVDVASDFAAKAEVIDDMMAALGLEANVIARVAGPNPAEWLADQHRTADAVAIAQLVAQRTRQTRIHLDTFVDVDRGYFRRAGLVDRQYDPRAGWHVMLALRELEESRSLRLDGCIMGRLERWGLLPVTSDLGRGYLIVGAERLGGRHSSGGVDLQASSYSVFDLSQPWGELGTASDVAILRALLNAHKDSGPFLCIPN